MQSKKSLYLVVQLLFPWLVQISIGRDEVISMLVQLNDCTCFGYNQTFECTVFGGGFTIWRGTALSGCQQNKIQLRHSEYIDSQATGQCNGGEIMAKSVGASESYYKSQLSLAVGEEMVNETIECIHSDLQSEFFTIGQKTLNLTFNVPYPPPTNVHFEAIDSERNQVMFAWDEVNNTHCSSIQYVISAINCGVCPNTTINTNIVCVYTKLDVSVDTNHTCMFAVQTEICGYLRGDMNEYVTVHINEMITIEEDESTTTVSDSETVNNASTDILVPLVSSMLSVGIFLLLLVVVVLGIFMRKQVVNIKPVLNAGPGSSIIQEEEFAHRAQNKQEGIYSLLRSLDDNVGSGHKEVVYADIGPNLGEQGLRCETLLRFQDDKVEYAEIKSLNHESALSPLLAEMNDLLLQFGTSKWYQLGIAIGISEEILDECSSLAPQEAVVEVLEYWMKKCKPSWEDVVKVLKEIGLNELANKVKLQMKVKDDINDSIESLQPAVSTAPWNSPKAS